MFEQDFVLSYKSRPFIDDRDTGVWVAAYTERLVDVYAAVFMINAACGTFQRVLLRLRFILVWPWRWRWCHVRKFEKCLQC